MAAATDVPGKFDVVINGQGYVLARPKLERATYGYSPTFVQRSNVQGDFGDNFQDFWLTWTQRDWSLGEQQKYYRATDEGKSRYWQATSLDVMTPGQAMMEFQAASVTYGAAPRASCVRPNQASDKIYSVGTTNLYSIDSSKTITSIGAHGLGVAPTKFGLTSDGSDLYITSPVAPSVGTRKWDGAAFSTFSATGADCLEYLNNTLYGVRNVSSDLIRFSTAGTASVIFTWKQVDGNALATTFTRIKAFGGKLAILLSGNEAHELWIYDGTAPAILHRFPSNFTTSDMLVVNGVIFVSGHFTNISGQFRSAIFYYAAGSIGLLWQSDAYNAAGSYPSMCAYDGRIIFNDDATARLMMYDTVVGGVHAHCSFTVAGSDPVLVATGKFTLMTRNQTTAYVCPDTVHPSSSTLTTSLIDFDSSLDKFFRGGRFDGTIPTGATLDLAYRVNDLDGSFTTFKTGASSGVEYSIGVTGRAIAIKATLNLGSSTDGPTITRLSVRAAPVQTTFRRSTYLLDLSGRNGRSPVVLNNGSPHGKDGLAMATDLSTAATSVAPITITDRFGTFTGVIETDGFELVEIRPEEFTATVKVRQV